MYYKFALSFCTAALVFHFLATLSSDDIVVMKWHCLLTFVIRLAGGCLLQLASFLIFMFATTTLKLAKLVPADRSHGHGGCN
jgi:hypothetical protein